MQDLTPSGRVNCNDFATLPSRRYGGLLRGTCAGSFVVDAFVFASGTFSILAVIPLLYLALRSVRDARHLRLIHGELAVVMHETKELAEQLHELQHQMRHEQLEAKTDIGETRKTVEQVTEVVESAAGQVAEAAMHVAQVTEKRGWLARILRRTR